MALQGAPCFAVYKFMFFLDTQNRCSLKKEELKTKFYLSFFLLSYFCKNN